MNSSVFTKTSVETRGKFLAVAKHLLKSGANSVETFVETRGKFLAVAKQLSKRGANSVETFVETRGKPRHQAREELAACDTLMRQSYFFL